ncbi:hypothetical protein LC55x_4979 [Lysobacter capsici]|jgi:hypothetical protein|uniref:Uncharacterized protein n=1 Tax=Lysobacter capsici AZ78 TaxID=1444315 RepID=A0A108UBC7_9GAMM|nr:hypothetical protein LC55x_4979 [Lysobacter capsici]KWS06013.1 hypothetical protein AZ78_3567 [Lysobacter capsici AZ78]
MRGLSRSGINKESFMQNPLIDPGPYRAVRDRRDRSCTPPLDDAFAGGERG